MLWPVRPDLTADARLVGRDSELLTLLGLLDPGSTTDQPAADIITGGPARSGSTVVVSAVSGAPGVGKSELAWAAARAALGRGWFGDRVFGVDLQGYAENPDDRVQPAQLYPGLLRALGLDRDQVPPQTSEQAAVYHQLLAALADADRPVLLVLDNVSEAEQVIPVLPRGGGHRVLVTSRDSLAELPRARLLDLPVLAPAAAVELLEAGLLARAPGDRRVRQDLEVAERVVELCGYLPLAVSIVAALLAEEPDRPIGELAGELADETTRLQTLHYNARWAVRAAFDLSYRRLDPPTAELFAALSAIPGPDLSLDAAAAAADEPASAVRNGLRALTRAHLLEARPGARRWRMHDLIRLYAAEQLPTPERQRVFERLLGWYRTTTDLAALRFQALPTDRLSAGFDTPAEALDWVTQEQPGLVAIVVRAATSHPGEAVGLALDLARFFEWTRSGRDWITTASATVGMVEDPHLSADAWINLGNALTEVRRFEEAIAALEKARDLYRELGDRHNEGAAWGNLGVALREVRRFEEAIAALEKARDLYRELGNRHNEGAAWGNLGVALTEVRRFEEAITALEKARDLYRELGDRHNEGAAWNNLGNALQNVRRPEEAITAHELARDLYRELGNRHSEGSAWNNLGNALQNVRRPEEAITAHELARDLYRELGDRHSEGAAWGNLGNALQEVQRFEEAITAHEQARDLFGELGDVFRGAQTLENLGLAHWGAGTLQAAGEVWVRAREQFRAAGDEEGAERVQGRLDDLGPDVARGAGR